MVNRLENGRIFETRKASDDVVEKIIDLRGKGYSWRGVADVLNSQRIPTVHGGRRWSATTCRRIAIRVGAERPRPETCYECGLGLKCPRCGRPMR